MAEKICQQRIGGGYFQKLNNSYYKHVNEVIENRWEDYIGDCVAK